jgi:flavin reductase (DIM6/NTAB) family NADH-FMN oxidoreductase RutF
MKRPIPLDTAYRLLNPGPLVLVSSLFRKKSALTPIAWHMPVSDSPPLVALEIWEGHFIYKAILETKDFVMNIPSSAMAGTIRGLGSVSGAKVDKFARYGLSKEEAKKVKSPRLAGAIAVMECKLHRDKALLEKYNIVLGDVVYAEAEEGLFTDRWLPEKGGPQMLHHLGSGIFSVPAARVV